MSEKRFERWNDYSCKVKDNQEDTLLNWEDVVDKLNEQQSIIHKDEISIKTTMSNMEKLEEENKQLKQEHKIAIDEMITDYKNLEKENEQLRQFITKGKRLSVKELMDNTNENELLKKKIKELKIERDDWKSSTYSYMNKDSILSMDCQIVREALWELEKEIEFGSKREDLFFDLKEKFEKLNNHRIGVYE